MPERVPRLNPNGVLIQHATNGDFVGRSMSRNEAERNGNSPVVCVLLFDGMGEKRKVLLQQRASHKSRWSGQWEGSTVETAQMNSNDPWEPEHPSETGKRGLKEELSLEKVLFDDPYYYYKFVDNPGVSSIMTIYTAVYDEEIHGSVVPNPREIKQVEWVGGGQLLEMVENNSREFAPGFSELILTHPEILR